MQKTTTEPFNRHHTCCTGEEIWIPRLCSVPTDNQIAKSHQKELETQLGQLAPVKSLPSQGRRGMEPKLLLKQALVFCRNQSWGRLPCCCLQLASSCRKVTENKHRRSTPVAFSVFLPPPSSVQRLQILVNFWISLAEFLLNLLVTEKGQLLVSKIKLVPDKD